MPQLTDQVIRVGMAQFEVGHAPAILMTSGLGSCVGVTMYDSVAKVGGLAHIMLPDSLQARDSGNRAKFADTAIPDMLEAVLQIGGFKERLIIKMAGGAQMFSFGSGDDRFAIGKRNAEAVRLALGKLGLRVVREDIGGNHGRTLIFNVRTGEVVIKTIDAGMFCL